MSLFQGGVMCATDEESVRVVIFYFSMIQITVIHSGNPNNTGAGVYSQICKCLTGYCVLFFFHTPKKYNKVINTLQYSVCVCCCHMPLGQCLKVC